MTGAVKAGLGLTLITISGLGSWQIYEHTRPKKVKDYLNKNVFLDLTQIEDEDTQKYDYQNWKTIVDNDTKLRDFVGWTQTPSTDKDKINQLKTKCRTELDKDKSKVDNSHFENIKNFCTKSLQK